MKRISGWMVLGPLQFFFTTLFFSALIRLRLRAVFDAQIPIGSAMAFAFALVYTVIYWRFQGFGRKSD
ncbi:MAG: hypothetical protein EON58_13855 [Alphaproteobacteria bacterium]|nr:MAG: hypothetical protein EON58_13855 [Alphaproteobacteria bacterium]